MSLFVRQQRLQRPISISHRICSPGLSAVLCSIHGPRFDQIAEHFECFAGAAVATSLCSNRLCASVNRLQPTTTLFRPPRIVILHPKAGPCDRSPARVFDTPTVSTLVSITSTVTPHATSLGIGSVRPSEQSCRATHLRPQPGLRGKVRKVCNWGRTGYHLHLGSLIISVDYVFVDEHNRHKRLKGMHGPRRDLCPTY